MSKTDKTRPHFVHEMEYGIEVHNHESGVCTLDSYDYNAPHKWRGCYIEVPWWMHSKCCASCASDREWMHQEVKMKRRRDRVTMRKITLDPSLYDEALFSDWRHDAYSMPSW